VNTFDPEPAPHLCARCRHGATCGPLTAELLRAARQMRGRGLRAALVIDYRFCLAPPAYTTADVRP